MKVTALLALCAFLGACATMPSNLTPEESARWNQDWSECQEKARQGYLANQSASTVFTNGLFFAFQSEDTPGTPKWVDKQKRTCMVERGWPAPI